MVYKDRLWTIAGRAQLPDYAGDGRAAGSAALNAPAAIALDARGDVYIADTGNNRIREIVAG
jgi:hypothetical protein